MENIFRHATLEDHYFIKEIHPIRYRAGKAHLVSDHQHGEWCKNLPCLVEAVLGYRVSH